MAELEKVRYPSITQLKYSSSLDPSKELKLSQDGKLGLGRQVWARLTDSCQTPDLGQGLEFDFTFANNKNNNKNNNNSHLNFQRSNIL